MRNLLLLFVAFAAGCSSKDTRPKPHPDSLYQRLGGMYGIAAVVDDFIDRVVANPAILQNAKFKAALRPERLPGVKVHVANQLAQAAGGPEVYTGRDMKEAHDGLELSEKDWDAAVQDLMETFRKFEVPKKEQDEIIAILAPTKKDIVQSK